MQNIIRKILSFVLLGALFLTTTVTPLYATEDDGLTPQGEYVLDEIIIGFHDISMFPGREHQYNQEVRRVLQDAVFNVTDNVYVIRVEGLTRNANAIFNRFKNSPYIAYVERNYLFTTERTSTDPNFNLQRAALEAINAPGGWAITTGEGSPIIAVIDTGVVSHPDMPPLLPGIAVIVGQTPNNDVQGHGTRVAGVIGMDGNNGIGGAGLNWNAQILPVKVDTAAGAISAAAIARGIYLAIENGASIINISLASPADNITLRNAINDAHAQGVAIFAGTGNEGRGGVSFPAAYPNVMGVGATNDGRTRASFSNHGVGLDVLAFGSFHTTNAAGGYGTVSGTSVASPQVAGLASLVLSVVPGLSPNQLYDLIRQNAQGAENGWNPSTGFGVIDVEATILAALALFAPEDELDAPTITLLGDEEMTIFVGEEFEEPGYTAEDALGVDITHLVREWNEVDTDTPGTYIREYSVEDARGLITVVERIVTVVAVEAPTITLLGDEEMTLLQGAVFTEPGYTAVDALGVDITDLVREWNEVNTAVPGTYVREYSVEDARGVITVVERVVTVAAMGVPVIILNGAETLVLTEGDEYAEPGFTATDALLNDITANVRIWNEVNTNVPGVYVLEYSVEDAWGNITVAERTITVVPAISWNTPPVITLVGGDVVSITVGEGYAEPGFAAVDANGVDLTGEVEVSHNINVHAIGIYTVQYRVTDGGGNETAVTRTVNVEDLQFTYPPTITLSGSAEMSLDMGQRFDEPGFRAVDMHGRDITDRVRVESNVDVNTPGTYTVNYMVEDDGGNGTLEIRLVEVIDTRPVFTYPPTLTLNGFVEHRMEAGSEFIESGFVAYDMFGSDLTYRVRVSGQVFTDIPGLYTVNYEVTDDGNRIARAERSVIVEMPESPHHYEVENVLSLIPIGSNPIILHLGGSRYVEQGAHAMCDTNGDLSSLVVTSGNVDINVPGVYTVNYRVTNFLGQEAIATREVRVLAPTENRIPRMRYNFGRKDKSGTSFTFRDVVAESSGTVDISVTRIDRNMSITVSVINTQNGQAVITDSFSSVGTKQYQIAAGRYEVRVAITQANGNSEYAISLLMPEFVEYTFEMQEVPIGVMYAPTEPVESVPAIQRLAEAVANAFANLWRIVTAIGEQ